MPTPGERTTFGQIGFGSQLLLRHRHSPVSFWEQLLELPAGTGAFLAGLMDGDGCIRFSRAGDWTVSFHGGLADIPLLTRLAKVLGSGQRPRVYARRPGSVVLNFYSTKTHLRLALLLGGELRHPLRRFRLRLLRRRLNLGSPPPASAAPQLEWFAGHLATDGCVGGLGLRSPYPKLAVTAKYRKALLEPWRRRWGGGIHRTTGAKGSCHQWQVAKAVSVLKLAARLRPVLRTWHSAKEQRLCLLPLVYALRYSGAANRSNSLHPYWQLLLGLWRLRKVSGISLVVGGRGRLAAAGPLARRLQRSMGRPGNPWGTRQRRLLALWRGLPAAPELTPHPSWCRSSRCGLPKPGRELSLVASVAQIFHQTGVYPWAHRGLPRAYAATPPPQNPASDLPEPAAWGPVAKGSAAAGGKAAAGPPRQRATATLPGPLAAALLDAGGSWECSGGKPPKLRLLVGFEQRPLLAQLAQMLAVAGPKANSASARTGFFLTLGPNRGVLPLAVAALPHCRRPAAAPPPSGWAASAPLPTVGSAVAAETPAQRRLWALTVVLLRGQLLLAKGSDGVLGPRLQLESASWRGANPAAERALLAAVAAATGAAGPHWVATAGSRGRAGVWQLVVAEGPLGWLAEELAAYPLPLGGRWPLLPEALALAAVRRAQPADEAPAAAEADLCLRWESLASGRLLGGRRRLPSGRPPTQPVFLTPAKGQPSEPLAQFSIGP